MAGRSSMSPWTEKELAYLLGRRSPLTKAKQDKIKAELEGHPELIRPPIKPKRSKEMKRGKK